MNPPLVIGNEADTGFCGFVSKNSFQILFGEFVPFAFLKERQLDFVATTIRTIDPPAVGIV
jgi:hypothetical protein